MSSNIQNNLKDLLKNIESRASFLYKYHYKKYFDIHYDNLIVENLMCNGRCHLVAVFKNYLIEDDNSEYLRRFYKYRESAPRLKKLFLYHEETSVIFPNYTPLIESKYLYNNVIRKQRVIDEQQDLENIRNELKLNKRIKENLNSEDKVFNSTVFGDILISSDSVLRIVFGIEKNVNIKDNNANNDKIDKNNIKSSTDNNNDYEDIEIKNIIKEIDNAEDNLNKKNNNNALVGYKLNSNNALKYKLKLLNNNQTKNKNIEKLNNLTNNSTNITSSSNKNINSNMNKIKNNQNLINLKEIKDTLLISKNMINVNQKIRNSLSITNNNNNAKSTHEKIKYSNNMTIPNHKKSNSTIPSRTLYGLNFHSNNNNFIVNLINQEKKKNLRNNSISHSNNTSRINNNNCNNNYIYNNNFPLHSKVNDKRNIYNNKFESSNKSNKILNKIPKIDMHKLEIINNNYEKVLTLTNRNSYRNHHNHILNNPNLFFLETEVLKSERNILKKRTKKKDSIKTNIGPTFSPTNYKSKVIFGRNSNTKLVIINDQNLKTFSQNKKSKQYFPNKNINKSSKKLVINEYNLKTNQNIINKDFYNNKYFRKHTNGP